MNILILGMPNVGKTSLYNLITNKNNNIIHDTIGTTRDWHVSPLKSNGNIDVFDTPGIINLKNLVTVEKILKSNEVYFEKIGHTQKKFFEIEGEMKTDVNDLFKINNQWYNNY